MAREILKCSRRYFPSSRRREEASSRIQRRALRDIASKNRANNEAQCKTRRGGEKMMRGKIMEKPSVPMTRLVIRKRANGSRRCNENNRSPVASKDIARVY